jgi:RecA/RadA recombinase
VRKARRQWQLELLGWLADERVWLDHPDVPEECLDAPFREALDAMRRCAGTGPRWLVGAELLRSEGREEPARLLEEAARLCPPHPLDEVVEAVRALHRLDILQRAAREALQVDPGRDPVMAERVAEAALVSAISAGTPDRRGVRKGDEVLVDMLRQEDGVLHVPSGIPAVDRLLGGWRAGTLTLVLGLTGAGKTSLLVQSAAAAAQAGLWVHIVSAEMSAEDLAVRLVGDRLAQYVDDEGAPVTVERVLRREPAVMGVLAAVSALARDETSRVTLDDSGWQTVADILGAVCRRHLQSPLGILFVDYLQLIQPGSGTQANLSREQQVKEVAEALKRVATRFGIPVVAAAQLVDPPAWTGEARRSLTPAVRESRAAAHTADTVVEIEKTGEPRGRYTPYVLRVLKTRTTSHVGASVALTFDRWACRFEDARPTLAASRHEERWSHR